MYRMWVSYIRGNSCFDRLMVGNNVTSPIRWKEAVRRRGERDNEELKERVRQADKKDMKIYEEMRKDAVKKTDVLTLCCMVACLCSISLFSIAESMTS